MKRVLWAVGLCLLAIVGLFIAEQLIVNPAIRCWQLRRTLFTALDNAASVKVIEHSCQWDNINSANDPKYKEKTYATITLTPERIAALRKALPESTDISETTARMCIFEEHHRIEIVEKNGTTFMFRLCFQCGELELNNDGQRIMPTGWPSSLGSFVSSLGLHPKGPWQ